MNSPLRDRIKYLLAGTFTANQQQIGNNLGIDQSPFLSSLFNQNATLAQFFNTLFKSAIILGAILAVLRLGYAGFVYMTTDLPGQKGNARTIISEAILGLLLLLAVWLILNQINPQILNLDILQNAQPVQNQNLPTCPPLTSLQNGKCVEVPSS